MRLICTFSAIAKFAFWVLVAGLVLGLLIGYRPLSSDFTSSASLAAANHPHTERG